VIEDASKVLTRTFKRGGTPVVLLGTTRPELGGSEYLYRVHGLIRGQAPALDLDAEKRLQRLLVDAAAEGLLLSAHDCSEGGLAVTLAECCFDTGGIGVVADVPEASVLRPSSFVPGQDATLFSESATRVVASTSPEDLEAFLQKAKAAGVPAALIGRTGGTRIAIQVAGVDGLDISVADAEQVWAHAIERYFNKTL
jgi:phosphoribosylformylglycinamidine (FGAM) synthase-like enzyme